jgi:hypothetical protein
LTQTFLHIIAYEPGVPDAYQKSQFGYILGGLCMEKVGIFLAIWNMCGHSEYFMATWNILWPFGIFYGYLVHFSPFWFQEKSGNLEF